MASIRVIASALLVLTPALGAWADDAPPPPQHEWIGKGQFGFLDSKGNSDAESINGNIDMLRYDDAWKNEFYVGALYGKSAGITTAQRFEGRGQSDYNFTDSLFAFGGLRYEHDLFDGFQYQASATGGLGYKFIDTNAIKLSGQVGVGYRRLRPEDLLRNPDNSAEVTGRVLHDAQGEAIGTAGLDFAYIISKTTTLTNKFVTEAGSDNTMLHDEIALTVKMTDKLALSVGYAVTKNTKPPASIKQVDTLSTVNLVFAF